MHLRSLLIWLFTLLALASLAAGSLLLSLFWFGTTTTSEWRFVVVAIWTPTTVVALVLGTAAFLAAGRLRMLVPYLGLSGTIFYISFIIMLLVTGTSLFSLLLLITVNCVAIYLAWEVLLWERPAAPMRCPSCGRENLEEAAFCGWCGSTLPRELSQRVTSS